MEDLQAMAKLDYKNGMGPTAISKKHNVSLNTVKSWIRRWKEREGAPHDKKGAPSSHSGVHPEERGVSPPPKEKRRQQEQAVEIDEEPTKPALTWKQEMFVQEFLVDLNATQAAIRAGYKPKNARVQAAQLLSKLNIRRAVRQAILDRIHRTRVSQDWVLHRLVRLADYDLRDFANLSTVKRIFETKSGDVMEDEVQIVVLNPEFDGSIAKSLFQDKDGIKLEMPDRVRALELIGKHIGMFSDPHKQRMDKARLELDRERVEIDKAKAKKDALGNDVVIKVKLPEVIPDGDD